MLQAHLKSIVGRNAGSYTGAMSRSLVWLEEWEFQGFGCSVCNWRFKPSGLFVGKSLDEMKRNFTTERDTGFAAHNCSEHPKATNLKIK